MVSACAAAYTRTPRVVVYVRRASSARPPPSTALAATTPRPWPCAPFAWASPNSSQETTAAVVVDAIRVQGQLDAMHRAFGRRITHVHLRAADATLSTRYEARRGTGTIAELDSYEQVREDPTERAVGDLAAGADVVIDTDENRPKDVLVRCAAWVGLLPSLGERLVHGYGHEVLDSVAGWSPVRVDWPEWSQLHPGPGHAAASAPPPVAPTFGGNLPEDVPLPRIEFPLFRHKCGQLLPDRVARLVDAQYLRGLNLGGGTPARALTPQTLTRVLAEAAGPLQYEWQVVAVLRGLQAGLWQQGVLLRVDVSRVAAILEQHATAPPPTVEQWRRLRAFAQPVHAAAVACALARLPARTLPELTVSAVTAQGSSVHVAGEPLPAGVAAYLRAALLLRRAQGAGPSDALFTVPRRENRDGEASAVSDPRAEVSAALRRAGQELGLRVPSSHADVRRDDKTWQRRCGLALVTL